MSNLPKRKNSQKRLRGPHAVCGEVAWKDTIRQDTFQSALWQRERRERAREGGKGGTGAGPMSMDNRGTDVCVLFGFFLRIGEQVYAALHVLGHTE